MPSVFSAHPLIEGTIEDVLFSKIRDLRTHCFDPRQSHSINIFVTDRKSPQQRARIGDFRELLIYGLPLSLSLRLFNLRRGLSWLFRMMGKQSQRVFVKSTRRCHPNDDFRPKPQQWWIVPFVNNDLFLPDYQIVYSRILILQKLNSN